MGLLNCIQLMAQYIYKKKEREREWIALSVEFWALTTNHIYAST